MRPQRSAVFLDRDGVLNRAYLRNGKTRPPDHLGQLELLPGVRGACQRLADRGLLLVVVTNQPDVARGFQRRARVEQMNDHLRAELPLHDVLTCFHDAADECACRKPRPGMLLEAARRLPIHLESSFLVGDRWSDVLAGQAAGCRTVLVETPYSERERCCPHQCVRGLAEAAEWIIQQSCPEPEVSLEAVH